MAKRSVTELQTSSTSQGQPYAKATTSGGKRDDEVGASEMGEFEDAWEDELESDEEVVENAEGDDEQDEHGQ